MRAGSLRYYVDVQRKMLDALHPLGDRGQDNFTWQAHLNIPIGIEPLSGRKLEIARQLVPTATHKLTFRAHEITPRDRFKWGERIFNIGYLLRKDERPFEMEAYVTEEL
jgi:head-tail adaptor